MEKSFNGIESFDIIHPHTFEVVGTFPTLEEAQYYQSQWSVQDEIEYTIG